MHEELGRASRAYVERVHDLDRVTDQLVGLYDTVLERGRAPRAGAKATVIQISPKYRPSRWSEAGYGK